MWFWDGLLCVPVPEIDVSSCGCYTVCKQSVCQACQTCGQVIESYECLGLQITVYKESALVHKQLHSTYHNCFSSPRSELNREGPCEGLTRLCGITMRNEGIKF